jgi:hypothetical protein
VKKFVRLYAEELVSVVPRTGNRHDGSRRSVTDLLEAALASDRQYRGCAAESAVFDAGLLIDGIDGPTRKYLQRQVTLKLYPWEDTGSGFRPRLIIPGGVSLEPPRDDIQSSELDEIALSGKPLSAGWAGPHFITLGDRVNLRDTSAMAEVCYLSRPSPYQNRSLVDNGVYLTGKSTS